MARPDDPIRGEAASPALVYDDPVRRAAATDRVGYWAGQAAELSWFERWDEVLSWALPFAEWFPGGRLNASFNCLDRHVEAGRGDRVAYHFEGDRGDSRSITYSALLKDVGRCGNALRRLGIERGDRVAIETAMIPELVVAMLACARIGAAYVVLPEDLPADELRRRIGDTQPRVVITADGGWSGGRPVRVKPAVDAGLSTACDSVEHVLVVRRLGEASPDVPMSAGRDLWWHEVVGGEDAHCPPEAMDSADLLFVLYGSSAGGVSPGIMHGTGGYLTQVAFTNKYVFDLRPETDVYWCTGDLGSATGHAHALYGPLLNGVTSVLSEGPPGAAVRERTWSIIEHHAVSTFYTGAATIASLMAGGHDSPAGHDLSSLRMLASRGESLSSEAWTWYRDLVGRGRCPVVHTWMQAETGAITLSTPRGAATTTLEAASAMLPIPGVEAEVVDDAGVPVRVGEGNLTFAEPWPSMLRGIYGDPGRFGAAYWSRFPGWFDTGVRVRRDGAGYLFLA